MAAEVNIGAVSRSRSRREQGFYQAQSSSGKGTREYRAVKRNYATLVDTLGKTIDPAHFARRLEERLLIKDGKGMANVVRSVIVKETNTRRMQHIVGRA